MNFDPTAAAQWFVNIVCGRIVHGVSALVYGNNKFSDVLPQLCRYANVYTPYSQSISVSTLICNCLGGDAVGLFVIQSSFGL